ncbi:MAG: hypothetical protein DMF57_01770 [Acidobacteria bacterium]|nr:MAG: hypothetical protein DMF57_01770 [Acidobacteriota bacterium]
MTLKATLKRVPIAHAVNAAWKCRQVKRVYRALCRKYETPSILDHPEEISALTRKRWSDTVGQSTSTARRRRIIFVGTDYEQDRSGILQALTAAADTHVFEHAPGHYGQRWPKSFAEADEVREHNARALREQVARVGSDGSLDAVIGQMWGTSMHWRVLAELRERGIAVINIAMDDRHAWTWRRMSDGTFGGTAGIAPYLSLGCTDAAECVGWYEAEGSRAVFFPEASDASLFVPSHGAKLYDVAFVGASYGVRRDLVHALQRAGVAVQAYGIGWPNGRIPTDDVPRLFASSRIVLGSGTIGHCRDFVALKLRDFDAPMSGSLYLTHDNPDFEGLFRVGREIATFRTVPEAVSKVQHFLSDESDRERIASAGRTRCSSEHTWQQRFAMLLSMIGPEH